MRVPSNAGSVVIEIVLAILVIVVGGYAAYETHVAHTSNPPPAGHRSTTQAQATPKVVPTPTAPSPVVYRVPELGFEMTLPPGLSSDLYYVADTTPRTGTTYSGGRYTTSAWADFSTHSLVAQEPLCAPSVTNTGGRGLDAMNVSDINPVSGGVEEPDLSVELGTGSWLSLDAKQGTCSRNDVNATLELRQFGLLEQAFKTARPL